MPALLRHDRENKSQRENLQVKMLAVAGYHTVICDAFIVLELTTVNSRYLDFGYLEKPRISKRKSGPCFNTEI